MTRKLYNEDHYLKEFDAKVVSVKDNLVELDQTVFYAEAGGQAGDTGVLNDARVVDTIYIDDILYHVLEEPHVIKPGDVIHGKLDWDRRYRIMKLHSASHMMEYFLWERFGYMKRSGSHVDDVKDRADYQRDERLDSETLKKVEEDTNRFLAERHEVIIEVDENGIRNWKCGPVEMHCAGTHVRNTSEIGAIQLKRRNPGRGEERVETSLAE